MRKKVAVIGAGLGGLGAAINLASKGFEVDVFEKNSNTGGKLNLYKENGYRFDTGPSILTMPFVIDELFKNAGKDRKDYLEFIEIDPIARNFFDDGSYLDTKQKINEFKNELVKFSKEDSNNIEKYIDYAKNIYLHSKDIFLFEPLHEVVQLIKENKFPSLLNVRHIDPLNTVHSANQKFFKNDNIIKIFDRYATYTGSDPYRAPAALNIIAYVELVLGGFYIKGGMYKLAEALFELANDKGINFHFNAKVDKIIHKDKQVKGLIINGNNHAYDIIVANSDVVTTFNNLIEGFDQQTKKYNTIEPSLSGFVMLAGINKTHDKLAHHNVFYSKDYKKEFEEIFSGKIPDDPTIYVALTSKTDPDHAPDGSENWFILLNMPYLNDEIDWNVEKHKVREKILKKLEHNGYKIENNIQVEKIFTPLDLYSMHLSNRGSIYGISSNGKMNAFKRPANRNRQLEGLYFATGSAHPGGGIPLVILSGKHCADLINRKYN